jgi:predicted aspartyl protease
LILAALAAAAAPGAAFGAGMVPPPIVPPPAPPPPPPIQIGEDITTRMTVAVHLNETGPYNFIVDTGANRSVVAIEVAAAMGLANQAQSPVHGIAGIEMADTVEVDRLTVGLVTARNLRLPLLGADRLGADGLLGIDVLRNRLVTLDFVNNKLTISSGRGDLSSRDLGEQARLFDLSNSPTLTVPARSGLGQLVIVDAAVGDIPVQAFLDSGSQDTVANLEVKTRALARHPHLAQNLTTVELLSATGQTAKGDLFALPGLHIGSATLDDISAVFADLHTFEIWGLGRQPALLIGMDVLRRFEAVDLDFAHRLVRFHFHPFNG